MAQEPSVSSRQQAASAAKPAPPALPGKPVGRPGSCTGQPPAALPVKSGSQTGQLQPAGAKGGTGGPQRAKQSAYSNKPLPQPGPVIPARQPASEKKEEVRRKKYFVLAGFGLPLLLVTMIELTMVLSLAGILGSGGMSRADEENTLGNLMTALHTWWDNEGFGSDGCKDPDGALERLKQKQLKWWDNESLAKDGSTDSTNSLGRLEELETDWWTSEGLNSGQTKDPAGAMKRLEKLARKWWGREGLAKAKPPEENPSAAAKAGEGGAAVPGSDLQVKLQDKESTRRFLDTGGTEKSEQAVQDGLKWLADQQHENGSWTPMGKKDRRLGGRGANDMAATAFALLPFLARGETHKGSEAIHTYTKEVDQGIKYLLQNQGPNGELWGQGGNMYVHCLATIALCEDLGMTNDPTLRERCQKAIDFIVNAQHPTEGGWRYMPKQPGDTSVVSWALMGLKSGQMAGLNVPRDTLDKAIKFLNFCSRPDGGYNYRGGDVGHSEPRPAVMTAAGIVCRQYLQSQSGSSEDVRSSNMTRGTDIILKHPPTARIRNYYYYYYATYALLPVGGQAWKTWNPQMRELLVGWQDQGNTDPTLKGSWDPAGSGPIGQSGRVGCTALALLTLEVYYRHLPLNRPDLGEMAKDLKATKGGK